MIADRERFRAGKVYFNLTQPAVDEHAVSPAQLEPPPNDHVKSVRKKR